MIGQTKLIKTISDQIHNEVYSRFCIIVGMKGSGKKTLCNMIPGMFKNKCQTCILPDVKVDTIRTMIEDSYKVASTTFYIIPDADSMSVAAKNAILKITEEPPNNAYFIITLQDIANTLPTIKSRGTIFHMDNYTPNEILDYAKGKYKLNSSETEIIIDVCETPLEVDIIHKNGIIAFMEYVALVVDNIAEVNGSNSFKIADKISFKDEDDKYNLLLFWKSFIKVCTDRLNSDPFKYSYGIKITSKYLQQLSITGINKQATFDMWLLDIREEWME